MDRRSFVEKLYRTSKKLLTAAGGFYVSGKIMYRAFHDEPTQPAAISISAVRAIPENGFAWPVDILPEDVRSMNFDHYYKQTKQHYRAIDIPPRKKGVSGDSVYAAAPGIVVETGWRTGYGKCVIIRSTDINGIEYRHLYAHLYENFTVDEQEVGYKTQIGTMGDTGAKSLGVHLHFEIYKGKFDLKNTQPAFMYLAYFPGLPYSGYERPEWRDYNEQA